MIITRRRHLRELNYDMLDSKNRFLLPLLWVDTEVSHLFACWNRSSKESQLPSYRPSMMSHELIAVQKYIGGDAIGRRNGKQV